MLSDEDDVADVKLGLIVRSNNAPEPNNRKMHSRKKRSCSSKAVASKRFDEDDKNGHSNVNIHFAKKVHHVNPAFRISDRSVLGKRNEEGVLYLVAV